MGFILGADGSKRNNKRGTAMSKLIPRNPLNIIPSNGSGSDGSDGSGNQPMPNEKDPGNITKVLKGLRSQLNALRNSHTGEGEIPGEADLERAIAHMEAARKNKRAAQVRHDAATPGLPAEPPKAPATRDSNWVGGSVAPGGVVGDGEVIFQEGVAGRDYVRADVYIAHADTVNGPGVNTPDLLRETYLQRMVHAASRVSLGQLAIRERRGDYRLPEITLERIYIPLDITRSQKAARQHDGTGRLTINTPVLDQLIRARRLVILGDPGSGKSTLINFLAITLALARLDTENEQAYLQRLCVSDDGHQRAAKWSYGALMPVRIELRELVQDIPQKTKKGDARLIWVHIKRQLERVGLEEFEPHLKAHILKGEALIMFDGLDEIPQMTRRKIVRDAISDFADSNVKTRYIVTCRELSYNDPDWQLRGFPTVTLAPLSDIAIHDFINNWYRAMVTIGQLTEVVARKRAAQLDAIIDDFNDLASNPMLLTVMAIVHTNNGTLPHERARLYNQCVNLLLWQWQRAKNTSTGEIEPGIENQLDTREELLVNALWDLAYEAHSASDGTTGAMQMRETEVMFVLKRYLDSWEKAEHFCQYVEERSGLLIGKGEHADQDHPNAPVQLRLGDATRERTYSFAHRGFQEFLAACYIAASQNAPSRLVNLTKYGDLWYEVMRLTIGHLVFNHHNLNQPVYIMDVMCPIEPPSDENGWRRVWWAAEMLALIGYDTAKNVDQVGERTCQRVMTYLNALVHHGELPPRERARAADALGHLRDTRSGIMGFDAGKDMLRINGALAPVGPGVKPQKVQIKAYRLARYPVTNYQFRYFFENEYLNDKWWSPQGLAWRERSRHHGGYLNDPHLGNDNRPVVGVTWFEAQAYATWLSSKVKMLLRLPTEVEWEYAAAGKERRRYPWGDLGRETIANLREAHVAETTAVGIFPEDITPEGVFDMGGNVWEWTSSLALDWPYQAGKHEDPVKPGARVLRGGSYDTARQQARCTERHEVEPHAVVPFIGFRLARDAE